MSSPSLLSPDARPRVFQVSELIRIVNLELAGRWSDVSVEGEVTNFTRSSAGHCYFTIKDEKAQLSVVLFAMYTRGLKFRIENGLKLVVRGKLGIYSQRGAFQLNAVAVEPVGLGALQLAFEQLKERLAAEGLFDPSGKKPIPMLPQRIAVVTSPTGAAIRDILNVLGRRFEGLSIQIYPVRVQGTTAGREIAAAIRNLSRWDLHDVVLICRGGGSLEDLWAFNEEVVARAIAECRIPTISGVGHEVDFTIADFVADLRAATPSAAAEIVIQAKDEICLRIDHAVQRIRRKVESRLERDRHQLRHLSSADRLGSFPRRVSRRREVLQTRRVSLYRLLERHARQLRSRLNAARDPLARFPERLAVRDRRRYIGLIGERSRIAIGARLERERDRLGGMAATLQAVSPLSVLARGYAIAFTAKDGRKPLLDSAAVEIGDPVEVQLKRGRLQCTVDGKTLGLETLWPQSGEGEE